MQLLDPSVPLEVVLTRLIAASAPSLAAIAAAAKRKQLRKKLRKMHHDSHHRKHSCKRDRVMAAGTSAAAEPSGKKQEAGGTSEDAVEETSSQDEGPDAADLEPFTASAPATGTAAGPSSAPITLRFSREARAAAAAEAGESSSRSKAARRPKLSRSSKSGLKLARRSGALADEDSDDLCKICYDRNVEFKVAGCEHPVCYKCAKLICRRGARDNPLCPFCRQGIEGFTRCQMTC